MNKKFVIALLMVMGGSHCFAMELTTVDAHQKAIETFLWIRKITPKDSESFGTHLKMAVRLAESAVRDKLVDENNPFARILNRMQDDFLANNSSLVEMIEANDLSHRIYEYENSADNAVSLFALSQVRELKGDFGAAELFLVRSRYLLAGEKLKSKYPAYHHALIGTHKNEHRIAFLKDNESYPVDEEATKEYMALFIYQGVIAGKI